MVNTSEILSNVQASAAGIVPGGAEVLAAVKQLSEKLPPGRVRDAFANGTALMPGGLIVAFLKKKKFMSGEYWLGEKYMFHVLGRTDINKRGKVPDEYVQPPQFYFTETLGVPVTTMDDLYALMGSAEQYLDRDPGLQLRGSVSLQAAQRASAIAKRFPESMQKWDFEAASLAFPVPVAKPAVSVPLVEPVPFSDPGISTADKPQELDEFVVVPSWWDRAKYLVLAGVLLVVLAGVTSWKKFRK